MSKDPDKGRTTSRYDDLGQLISTTDARNTTLHRIYDGLGRQTQLRNDSATGALRVEWTYDTVTGAKGQLASSTRHVNGSAYTTKVTQYDQLYRPMRTSVVISASEGALAGTYQTGASCKSSGLVAGVSCSAAGSKRRISAGSTFKRCHWSIPQPSPKRALLTGIGGSLCSRAGGSWGDVLRRDLVRDWSGGNSLGHQTVTRKT